MDPTRREALEAAFEKVETTTEQPVQTTGSENEAGKPYEVESKAAARNDEKSSETPIEKPVVEKTPPGEEATQYEDKHTEETSAKVAEKPEDDLKVPISWRPDEKTHWAGVPKEAKAAILRRELETQRALSSSAQARKFSDEFVKTVQPYAHLIRAQNSTPLHAVDNLMKTAAGLMVGNTEQKAAIVAEIISNYGVDVVTLDKVLTAAVQGGSVPGQGQAAIPPQIMSALKPMYDFMERVDQGRQQHEQQLKEQTDKQIEEFGQGKDFFEEVRNEMADLIEFSASKGRILSLQDAYDQVIAMNPKYRDAIAQKTHANEVSQAAATLAKARRAASSVVGSPTGGTMTPKPAGSRREALERAFDQAQ